MEWLPVMPFLSSYCQRPFLSVGMSGLSSVVHYWLWRWTAILHSSSVVAALAPIQGRLAVGRGSCCHRMVLARGR
jgi:hypothetical protein